MKATERGQAMGSEGKQDVSCSIKETLRFSIKTSWRCVSEHWALFSLALLLYLLYKFSPGFFSFLLSTSPVIICTALLLGILLSCGSAQLPGIQEDRNAPENISASEFGSSSRNVYIKTQQKRFPAPTLKENIIRESSFGRRDCNKHADLDENVPLLKQVHPGDERLDKILTSVLSLKQGVAVEEYMKANADRESKDAFSRKDKGDDPAKLFDDVHHSEVDGKDTNQADAQSNEGAGGVSDHNAADGAAGKCKWGRAFSVRRRKKLADIKIEAISSGVEKDNHENSAGFDRPDNAEGHSPDVSTTYTAPTLDETETGPLLGAGCSCPDRVTNNDSDNHSNTSYLDSRHDSGSNELAGKSKAKDDGEERKDDEAEPAFLWTADNEKTAMDLGYSEMERNRRLEILMVKRKSRKNMLLFDADELSRFRPEVHPISISARRMNPFTDDSEMPGSAPPLLHHRKNPFGFLAEHEQSNDGGLPSPHNNLEPQEEQMPAPHQDALFKRHESFSFGRPPQRHGPRFKPCFAPEELSFGESSAGSSFQRQFSDRSVSRLSAVSECDTASSVGDQEHNELIRSYIRGVRESPSLLGPQDGDGAAACPGNECSDGVGLADSEALNAAIC